uniref:Uncharacterized protein n=1 Tax=Clastoptera arizonana TaxID=38151 RepID=A0A1B6DP46_9HEMI
MGYSSKFPSKIKHMKGTRAFTVQNFYAVAILTVCSVIGIGISFTPPAQRILKEIYDENLRMTQEHLDKKRILNLGIIPKPAEKIEADKERNQSINFFNIIGH